MEVDVVLVLLLQGCCCQLYGLAQLDLLPGRLSYGRSAVAVADAAGVLGKVLIRQDDRLLSLGLLLELDRLEHWRLLHRLKSHRRPLLLKLDGLDGGGGENQIGLGGRSGQDHLLGLLLLQLDDLGLRLLQLDHLGLLLLHLEDRLLLLNLKDGLLLLRRRRGRGGHAGHSVTESSMGLRGGKGVKRGGKGVSGWGSYHRRKGVWHAVEGRGLCWRGPSWRGWRRRS